jgi:aspartate/methionine/tyrosine aminotransferase
MHAVVGGDGNARAKGVGAADLEALMARTQFGEVILVEDNCYGDVTYESTKPPAFYALDDYDQQVYICSLSKILAPGVRLGYFMAPPKLFRRVLNRRHDAGSNTLAASIVAEYLRSGVWSHCDEQNATFKHKRDLLSRALDAGIFEPYEGSIFPTIQRTHQISLTEQFRCHSKVNNARCRDRNRDSPYGGACAMPLLPLPSSPVPISGTLPGKLH